MMDESKRNKEDEAMAKAVTQVVKAGEAALPPAVMRNINTSVARITEKQYKAMLDAFRVDYQDPGKAALAGRVKLRTAEYAWTHGGAGRPPIADVLAREARDARALLAKNKQNKTTVADAVADANRDLAESRAASGRSLRVARGSSVAALAVGSNLLRTALGLSARLENLMEDQSWKPTPTEAVKLLKTIVELSKMSLDSVASVDAMEYRLLNAPPIHIEDDLELDEEEAIRILSQGVSAVQRVKQKELRDRYELEDVVVDTDTTVEDEQEKE